jgi:5-hydroxyisourate hydrolase
VISTHVLDTSIGRPAGAVAVLLDRRSGDGWERVGEGRTDADGRLRALVADDQRRAGVYRLTFATGEYLRGRGVEGFWPQVEIVFSVADPGEHHHVPLLLNPFGYATYRGS